MCTTREKKIQEYYQKIAQVDQLIKEINELSDDLANEMNYVVLRLYKEQNDQLEEIRDYFNSVNMHPENNTNETIISAALNQFYDFVQSLK